MKKLMLSAALCASAAFGLTACSSGAQEMESGDALEVAKTLEYTQLSDSTARSFVSRLQEYTSALADGNQVQSEALKKSLSQSSMRYRRALEDAKFDGDSAYRRGIAGAMLGFTGDPDVVPSLLAMATKRDELPEVRSRAVFGLFVMGTRVNESDARDQVVAALKTMMLPSNDNTSARVNAINAYAAIYNPSLGDTIAPIKSALNEDPSVAVRHQSLIALGEIADPAAVVDIVEFGLRDPEPRIRSAAALALGKIPSPLSLSELRKAASQDDSGRVRAEATFALAGQAGVADDTVVVNMIITGINDIDEGVREAAARAASKIGTQEAIRPLLGLTQDTSTNVRIAAISALGDITPKEREADVMPLVNALNDGDPYVVRSAQRSLQKVTGQNLGTSTRAWTTYYQDKYPERTGKNYDGPLPPVGDNAQNTGRRTTNNRRTTRNTRNTRNTSSRRTNRSSRRR